MRREMKNLNDAYSGNKMGCVEGGGGVNGQQIFFNAYKVYLGISEKVI